MQWTLLTTGCSILLIILLILKELRRPNRRFAGLRILSSVLAVGSLAALALPLTIQSTLPANSASPVVLLTEGADADSVKKFLANRDVPVLTTDSGLEQRFRPLGAKLIPGTDYLTVLHPGRPVEIFGYGLDPFDLKPLSGKNYRIHPPAEPAGVTSVEWPRELKLGATFRMQGYYRNPGSEPVKLVLKAFGTTLDSVIIRNEQTPFQLSAVPKQLGKSVFSLVCVAGGDTLSVDAVPVVVEKPEPGNVLVLASAPDFEYKFLKSWLTGKGYGVTVRSRFSKDRFDLQYTNTRHRNLERITPEIVAGYQVIIADHRELAALSPDELGLVKSAVERQGLGLLVHTDTTLHTGFYAGYFPVRPVIRPEQNATIRPVGERDREIRFDEPVRLAMLQPSGSQPVLTDHRNYITAARRLFGNGYVVVSVIPDSYPLMLQGSVRPYEQLWSALLSAAAPARQSVRQQVEPLFPVADEPAWLETTAPPGKVPLISVSGTVLVPEQDMNLYDRWHSVYWPEKPGWHLVESAGATPLPFFVYPKDSWQAVRFTERLNETRKHRASAIESSPRKAPQLVETPVPKGWLFLIFLICCGFLWYETKFL